MGPYRYIPLPTGPRFTRLVRLLPGSGDAEIRCEIFDFKLQRAQQTSNFEALSYVWGDLNDRKRIFIEDSYLDITANLHTALRYLRDSVLERVLWIDAICINQDDLAERSNQVGYMVSIYASAIRVVAWLGEDTSQGESCFTLLKLLARFSREERKGRFHAFHDRGILRDVDTYRQLRQNDSFTFMLQSPWFERIWVLQEAAAAQSFTFVYGQQWLADHVFCEAMINYRTFFVDGTTSLEEQELWGLISSVLYLVQWDAHPGTQWSSLDILPLRHMVSMFHTHDATDPKDKVYALLGMSTAEMASRPYIAVDYSKPWASVFCELVRYLLGSTVRIQTWNHRLETLLFARVFVLGRVGQVNRNVNTSKHELVTKEEHICRLNRYTGASETFLWTFDCVVYGNPMIQEGDIVVQVQGAERPIVIRRCLDHFEIICVSVDVKYVYLESGTHSAIYSLDEPTQWLRSSENIPWETYLTMIESYPHELALVWNLERPRILSHDENIDEAKKFGLSLVDRGLVPTGSPGSARTHRILAIIRLLDGLDDEKGLQQLCEHITAHISTTTKTQDFEINEAVTSAARMLSARNVSGENYSWIKQKLFEILGNQMAHLASHEPLEIPIRSQIKLKSELSDLAVLSEFQLFRLLETFDPEDAECEKREKVLAALLRPEMKITEAMVEEALKLKGPMAKALLRASLGKLIVSEAMLVAASCNPDAESMFELLFEHFPGTSFPNKSVVKALYHITWNQNETGVGLFNRICARVLAHVQFDSETIAEFLALVFQRNLGRLRIEYPSSEIWLHVFRPHGKILANYVEHTDLCEVALTNASLEHQFLLDDLYNGYRGHARSALMSVRFSHILQHAKEQAMEIWKETEDFDAWKQDGRTFEEIFRKADKDSRRPARELILESIRTWLLAKLLFDNTP
ncbi:hypothetical protein DPSP01_002093 [Paraphaeosphaeria sporulosa]